VAALAVHSLSGQFRRRKWRVFRQIPRRADLSGDARVDFLLCFRIPELILIENFSYRSSGSRFFTLRASPWERIPPIVLGVAPRMRMVLASISHPGRAPQRA